MIKKKMKVQEEKKIHINNASHNNENTSDKNTTDFDNEVNVSASQPTENPFDVMVEETAEADKVRAEVKAVEEKLAEMQDKYLRLSAEFDNYRKRTLREKMDLSKYAGENILLSAIPLMDDFERALKHMDAAAEFNALKDGINIIYGKFGEFLKQYGIKEIESINNDFNVDLHEAVAKVPVEEDNKKGKVIDVVLKGYYLQDKVVRFAKVVVGE